MYLLEGIRRKLWSFSRRRKVWNWPLSRVASAYLFIFIVQITYCEWFCYAWKTIIWPQLLDRPDGIRVLLVADPQLIGYQNENKLIGPITRWDSDRHLYHGFSRAVRHFQPDTVMFLGDLFDEGIEANELELHTTISRFRSIFNLSPDVQLIYIPGDNDVGGEMEPVQSKLVQRFDEIFEDHFVDNKEYMWNSINVFSVNLMNGESRNVWKKNSTQRPFFSILLSHVPVLTSYLDTRSILNKTRPDIILSAHDHVSAMHTKSRDGSGVSSAVIRGSSRYTNRLGYKHPIIEFTSPTCSYRMGYLNSGYGMLSLSILPGTQDMLVEYGVLWMPIRMYNLISYLVYAVMFMLYIFYLLITTPVLCRRQHVETSYSFNKII